MRWSRGRSMRRVVALGSWLAFAALIAVGCQQTPPPTPVHVLGEGDTLEYAPGRTGEVHEVTLPGPGGEPFTFPYEAIDGLAIVQGDMIVGTAADFATLEGADEITVSPEASALHAEVCWMFLGIEIHCEHYLWPGAVVPYTFANDWDDPSIAGDENLGMRTTIRQSMDAIEAVSALRFVPRSSEGDYVTFRDGGGCSATVGHRGGQQYVNLNIACNQRWIIVHEILHALGFNHEQAREDRDGSVQIHWGNIIEDKKHNFEVADYSFDIGSYDYDSVMHYGGNDFCKTATGGGCVGPTITTIPAGTAIGQRSHLSATDIVGLTVRYPGLPPTLSITSPSPGSEYPRRSGNIYLEADVEDPERRAVTVTWSSNVSGTLGTGNPLTVNAADMAYGAHTITARGVDPQGHAVSDTVSVVITNQAPTVDLYQPIPGDFCVNESIPFRATVIDLNEPGATLPNGSVAWSVAGSTFATGKSVNYAFTSAGDRQVVVTATDELGLPGTDWVHLGIVNCGENRPPTVNVTTPASPYVEIVYTGYDSGRGMWYADVALAGTASDPEDGALSGSALTWTTDRSALQNAVLGHGTSLTARLYSNQCEGTLHAITLEATDGEYTRSAIVRIWIWTLC